MIEPGVIELGVGAIAVLAATAFAAGFIDAIAGGGGLITVPVLMLAGLPPDQALATNKVQGSFGAATAAFSYARSGLVDLRKQLPTAAIAFAAGVAGAALVTATVLAVLLGGLTGVGLLASTFTRSQVAALFFTMIGTLVRGRVSVGGSASAATEVALSVGDPG